MNSVYRDLKAVLTLALMKRLNVVARGPFIASMEMRTLAAGVMRWEEKGVY